MWEGVTADALCFERFSEFEVSVAHDAEVDELRRSNLSLLDASNHQKHQQTYQVDEPLQDHSGVVADLQEC